MSAYILHVLYEKNATTRTSYSVNMIDSIERINKMYLVVYWNLKRQPICFPMDHLCGYRIIISGYNDTKYLNIQFKSSLSSVVRSIHIPKSTFGKAKHRMHSTLLKSKSMVKQRYNIQLYIWLEHGLNFIKRQVSSKRSEF